MRKILFARRLVANVLHPVDININDRLGISRSIDLLIKSRMAAVSTILHLNFIVSKNESKNYHHVDVVQQNKTIKKNSDAVALRYTFAEKA